MPRRVAAERFAQLSTTGSRAPGEVLADQISALANARRRRLLDELTINGPAPVGKLAQSTGMAVGSVSHHIRVLARAGLVLPAPELAHDTRESWWAANAHASRWSSRAFAHGTEGEQLAQLATTANLDYLVDAVHRWGATASPAGWEGTVADALVNATAAELADLGGQIAELAATFAKQCRARALAEPDEPRRPVRLVAFTFPEAPHRD